jgi:sulfur-carrier protein
MQVNILLFGQLAEIAGKDNLVLHDVPDTGALVNSLHQLYPQLAESKFVIAVDKKVISTNTPLNDSSTVALLPPFSGG